MTRSSPFLPSPLCRQPAEQVGLIEPYQPLPAVGRFRCCPEPCQRLLTVMISWLCKNHKCLSTMDYLNVGGTSTPTMYRRRAGWKVGLVFFSTSRQSMRITLSTSSKLPVHFGGTAVPLSDNGYDGALGHVSSVGRHPCCLRRVCLLPKSQVSHWEHSGN